MLSGVLGTLRWCASLGRKFTAVVPGATLAVVLATLVSQLCIMLATFLPLKIVILLGSEGVPRYFPSSFAEVDRDFLVALLSLSAILAFVMHMAAERFCAFSAVRGARQLLRRSQKLVLFENQDELAASAYQSYARALAGAVFAFLVMGVLAFVYPEMAVVISAFVLSAVLGSLLAGHFSSAFSEKLASQLPQIASVTGNVGFLVGFAWLVTDFVFFSPPGLLPAIISLLLSRLALMRLSGMIADIYGLNRKRSKLDALFFHGKALVPAEPVDARTFWPLLQPATRKRWIKLVLREFCANGDLDAGRSIEIEWRQLRVPNVAGLSVRFGSSSTALVKLFDRSRQRMARHEATLLGSEVRRLPAPHWLGATVIEEFHCHAFDLTGIQSLESPGRIKEIQVELISELLCVEPPPGLVQQFQRSRPQLHQRMHTGWFDKLAVAADPETRTSLAGISGSLPTLQDYLRALPPVIVNPDISGEHLAQGESQIVTVHWGDWRIEPLGCGWPARPDLLDRLDDELSQAAELRPSLQGVNILAVRLAAVFHVLEQRVNRQRLSEALDLIPEIEQCLERLKTQESGGTGEGIS